MKRAKLDAASKVAVVKLELEANASLAATAQQVDQLIHHQRSGERTAADAEFGLLDAAAASRCCPRRSPGCAGSTTTTFCPDF